MFACMILVFACGLVFCLMKEQYVVGGMCLMGLIFSMVVTRFYASNFQDINEIIKGGLKNYCRWSRKVVEFVMRE